MTRDPKWFFNVMVIGWGNGLSRLCFCSRTAALPKLPYLIFMANQQDNHLYSIILTLHLRKLMLKDR